MDTRPAGQRRLMRLLSCVGLACCVLLISAGSAAAQHGGASQCLGPNTNSTALINWVRQFIKGTNIHTDSVRDNVGFKGIDTSSVSLVTNSKTCASAALAIDQLANVSTSGRPVYVVQVGRARLVVQDPGDKAGPWLRTWVFDSSFRAISALGY
jgi:hypothetical protein